jgi:hypothetical protein
MVARVKQAKPNHCANQIIRFCVGRLPRVPAVECYGDTLCGTSQTKPSDYMQGYLKCMQGSGCCDATLCGTNQTKPLYQTKPY